MKYFETPEAKEKIKSILSNSLIDAEKLGYSKAIKDLESIIIELESGGMKIPKEIQETLECMFIWKYD